MPTEITKTYILILATPPHVVSIHGESLEIVPRSDGEYWVIREGGESVAEIKKETVVGWVKELPQLNKAPEMDGWSTPRSRSMWPIDFSPPYDRRNDD